MKKVSLFVCLLISLFSFSQTPQGFTYQAVATDFTGAPYSNTNINVKASIISGSISGILEYEEEHLITSDAWGLFTIDIGTQIQTGGIQTSFSNVDWGNNGPYYLKFEIFII